MRYLGRTHRVSISWLKEVCDTDRVHLMFAESATMAADMYTKAFTDVLRWDGACALIQIGTAPDLAQRAQTFSPAPDGGTPTPDGGGKGGQQRQQRATTTTTHN